MHWTIEILTAGDTWFCLCRCGSIEAVLAIIQAIAGPTVENPAQIRISRLPYPLAADTVPVVAAT